MAVNALNIACYFIKKSFEEKVPISNMKMQKMVYIANGFYIAAHGEPLIIERIEVWAYGPVVKPLYDAFKPFGSGTIDRNILYCELNQNYTFTQEQLDTLDFTWETCKEWDGIRLSNWTHRPDSPWTLALSQNKSYIPDDMIVTYFSRFTQTVDGK